MPDLARIEFESDGRTNAITIRIVGGGSAILPHGVPAWRGANRVRLRLHRHDKDQSAANY
jgi:hypothetical protein